MPNIADIIEIAESLRAERIHVVATRCAAVRHRRSKCSLCMDACIADAISVSRNEVHLDVDACVSCGACTTVCPTEALVPLDPTDAELYLRAAASREKNDGRAIVACARIAARREADPSRFAEVPCLARVEESLLVRLAADGARSIELVDGTCATCKHRGTGPVIDDTVAAANEIFEVMGSSVRVERASAFPACAKVGDASDSYGSSRRGFFGQAKDLAWDAAGKTVEHALQSGAIDAVPTLRDLLKVDDEGNLPQFEPVRHTTLLDSMAELGEPVRDELFTRRFGAVSIDREACNSCAMCTVFCPTRALVKSQDPPTEKGGVVLEFSAMLCIQCGLCRDVCLKECLEVLPSVPTDDLFDFEPRVFDLPRPAIGRSIFACR